MIQVDQSQYTGSAVAGLGQTAVTRYRGMGFTPTLNYLSAISFKRNVGIQGIKVYIDTADVDSIPLHAVGSEIYSFVIPNSLLSSNFKRYMLPIELAVTPGTQYCFYLAPWSTSTDTYTDDYQDMTWTNSNPYSGGKPIINTAGTWAVSDSGNLDALFDTWGRNTLNSGFPIQINGGTKLRPRPFAPGIAR